MKHSISKKSNFVFVSPILDPMSKNHNEGRKNFVPVTDNCYNPSHINVYPLETSFREESQDVAPLSSPSAELQVIIPTHKVARPPVVNISHGN